MNTKLLLTAGLTTGLVLQLCPPTLANPITVTGSASPGMVIPDDNLNGLASSITLSTPISEITGLNVTLDIVGGFNGDYYAYLQYGSALVVLLNNLGSNTSNPWGSPGSGFNVTFSDEAASISTAPMTADVPLTSAWAPQAGSLSAFNGQNPNGDWTLFIASTSPGGVGTLESWGLSVAGNEVAVVPEDGSNIGLLAVTVLSIVALIRQGTVGGQKFHRESK